MAAVSQGARKRTICAWRPGPLRRPPAALNRQEPR